MSPSWHESAVSLEKLDGHLKALLRLKIREFVHLSPWFNNDPQVEPKAYAQMRGKVRGRAVKRVCPNRRHSAKVGRRHVRVPLYMSAKK